MILCPYPLPLSSDFTPSDREAITAACLRVGGKLSRFTGLGAWATYCKVFAGLEIVASYSVQKYYAYTYPGGKRIVIRPRKTSVPLLVHELGHAFDCRITWGERPHQLLMREGIRTPDGKQFINGRAPANGFITDRYGPTRQHPIRWDNTFCHTEDFADMFMCWVLGTLADNSAGDARRAWMDGHMEEWVGC